MISALYVFLGGGLGSLCRYMIGSLFPSTSSHIGTLVANIIACAFLGFLMGLNAKELLSSPNRLLLATGFCGGFSTFSTFSGELVSMSQQGQIIQALGYGAVSIISGVIFILIGLWLAKGFAG